MLKSTETGQEELKTTSCTTSERNSLDSSFEATPLENTPFHLIKSPEQGYFITWGMFRLIEPQKTKEDALVELERNRWNIFTMLTTIMLDAYEKQKATTTN